MKERILYLKNHRQFRVAENMSLVGRRDATRAWRSLLNHAQEFTLPSKVRGKA